MPWLMTSSVFSLSGHVQLRTRKLLHQEAKESFLETAGVVSATTFQMGLGQYLERAIPITP